jgi:acetyltransferase-like isoleucine patch superfamily enzyme
MMKQTAKTTAELVAMVVTFPAWLLFIGRSLLFGKTRACAAASQMAAGWSGVFGEYLRRMLFRRIFARIGREVVVSFGTVLTKPTIELGDGVYIGSYCLLGDVHVGENTLIADHVCIPSGGGQHGIDRLDVPIREQPGEFRTINIGRDCWIGSNSVILADVGNHCVVAAGSIVTKPLSDYQIVVGNPAVVIGNRRDRAAAKEARA